MENAMKSLAFFLVPRRKTLDSAVKIGFYVLLLDVVDPVDTADFIRDGVFSFTSSNRSTMSTTRAQGALADSRNHVFSPP